MDDADALGGVWRVSDDAQVRSMVHQPTGIEFVVVPGGRFEFGFSQQDRSFLAAAPWWDEDWAWSLEIEAQAATPSKTIELPGFLLERRGPGERTTREEALDRARSLGLRLASEAELEWVLRNGGVETMHLGASPEDDEGTVAFQPSRLGVEDLLGAHWVADDWHPDHEAAFADGRARTGGDPAGVCRVTFALDAFVCLEDMTALVAALRTRGSPSMPAWGRLAAPLPGH